MREYKTTSQYASSDTVGRPRMSTNTLLFVSLARLIIQKLFYKMEASVSMLAAKWTSFTSADQSPLSNLAIPQHS